MSEYIEFLKEVFEQFAPIYPLRRFGGYNLFHKGCCLASTRILLKIKHRVLANRLDMIPS